MLATGAPGAKHGQYDGGSDWTVRVPIRTIPAQASSDETGLHVAGARAIRDALTDYPHAVVLRWGERANSHELTYGALRALYCLAMQTNAGDLPKVDCTRIAVNKTALRKQDGVTRVSRSNLAMPLHTDSTYQRQPYEVVAMHMARPSRQGGKLILAPLAPVLADLPDVAVQALQEPVFPFGAGRFPVMARNRSGDWAVRYYRQQIDNALQAENDLDSESREALRALDQCLAGFAARLQMPLQSGDAIFLKNHRILHGRTSFPATSGRILYRYRMRCPALT